MEKPCKGQRCWGTESLLRAAGSPERDGVLGVASLKGESGWTTFRCVMAADGGWVICVRCRAQVQVGLVERRCLGTGGGV